MIIPAKSPSQLPARLQQLHAKASEAMQAGRSGVALQSLALLVQEEPGCTEARRALREAQLAELGGRRRGVPRWVAAVRLAWPLRCLGPRLLQQGQEKEALRLAERLLSVDPSSRPALLFLAQAAAAAGLHQAAVDALQVAVRLYPTDVPCWQALATQCTQAGQCAAALEALKRLSELRPGDLGMREWLAKATAAVATRQARERTRPGTANPQGSTPLEAGSGTAPELSLPEQIAQLERGLGPETPLRLQRDLARLYVQAKRFDAAVDLLRQAAARPDADDDSFQQEVLQVCEARHADAVARCQAQVKADPAQAEAAKRQIAALQAERGELLLAHQRRRAQRYPHDSRVRFALGEMLQARRDWDGAIEEFQAARSHPNLMGMSLASLGRCLAAKGLAADAARHLEQALESSFTRPSRDRLEVMYDLALVYETLERAADANRLIKEIYAQDLTFRDVKARLQRLAASSA